MFLWPTILALSLVAPPPSNDKLFAEMDFASGAKDAVGMLAPEKVCDAAVKQAVWSSDGKYIAFEVSDYGLNASSAAAIFLDPTVAAQQTESRRVVAWSADDGKTRHMFSVPDGAEVSDLKWLARRNLMVVSLSQPIAAHAAGDADPEPSYAQTVGIVYPDTGKFQTLYSGTSTNPVTASLSSVKPLARWWSLSMSRRRRLRRLIIGT